MTVSSWVLPGFMDRAAEELPAPAPVGPRIPVAPVTPGAPGAPVKPPVPPPPPPGAPVGPVAPKVLGTFRREENDKVEVVKEVVVIEEANSVDTLIVLVLTTQLTIVELIIEVAINELTVILDPTNVLN